MWSYCLFILVDKVHMMTLQWHHLVTKWPNDPGPCCRPSMDTMVEKRDCKSLSELLSDFVRPSSSNQDSSQAPLMSFIFPSVTAVQARWRHFHIPLVHSSHATFSGLAGALSLSSLCHSWHLRSFCYPVCVGLSADSSGATHQSRVPQTWHAVLPKQKMLWSLCNWLRDGSKNLLYRAHL